MNDQAQEEKEAEKKRYEAFAQAVLEEPDKIIDERWIEKNGIDRALLARAILELTKTLKKD